jgi:hypothetical protein
MHPAANAVIEPATVADEFDAMTDREILLTMARDIRTVRALAAEAGGKVQPLIDGFSRNPMFKLLLK